MWRSLIVAAACATLVSSGVAGAAAKRSISITGVSVQGSVAVVTVKIAGWKMYPRLVGKTTRSPDGGHWHIFVDGKYNGFSASATTGKTLKLADGQHVVRAELARNDHSPLKPPVRSRAVSVTIGGAPPGGGSEPPPSDPGYDPGYG